MCFKEVNRQAEVEIMKASEDATCNEDVDDLVNILENQLDYLYYFHEFKTEGRKPTVF